MAAGHSVEPARWAVELDRLLARMAGRFPRVESRRWARVLLNGLLTDSSRRNCWTIAEHAGQRDPYGMQHFLSRGVWDTDGVRDDLRDYVTTALGDTDGVLVVDETGDLKKGRDTVGVQRQYTGTAGRIENCQVAVHLTYAGPAGHAMIDRELYLPESWTSDEQRLAAAGVPDGIGFATKPALATGMLTRAIQGGVLARWVTGDEVYGADPTLRAEIEYHQLGYVLAIGGNRMIPTAAGPLRADLLVAGLSRSCWQRLSAGAGAKGQRVYEWAWIAHPNPAGDPAGDQDDDRDEGDPLDTRCWWLLVRRSRSTGELAYYRCYSPNPVPLRELVRVAGTRWRIEETFQAGKELAGLDQHQVRRWTSWQRWTLLSMIAHALLAVIAAREAVTNPAPAGWIALTCNEVRRLFQAYVIEPARRRAPTLAWSFWRRHQQYRARTSHYTARGDDPPS